jgi:hypothetical protein
MTVARAAPALRIRKNISSMASAVQTTPRKTMASVARGEGSCAGHTSSAGASISTLAAPRLAATGPYESTPCR